MGPQLRIFSHNPPRVDDSDWESTTPMLDLRNLKALDQWVEIKADNNNNYRLTLF